MSAARRSLLTATAAGTLLGALWFVPSANATPEEPARHGSAPTADRSATTTTAATTTAPAAAAGAEQAATEPGDDQTRLADTGSVNTTPYVVGGTLFLGLGAGFVTYSVRRERTAAF
ncbi:LPXTG cell wall anchor domain-containing protein [Streptomyces sp. NBC_01571]|uniref:LPXTG cell wall anchor domain-containing protein n=1 Tax=Streptomyces sp. NBC_01571 TaxID=2975883 RepID=UPI00225925A6|nr:LPXTG cell wall anchor domain-containing protein [Streptomyces sp. NBC_01571]MCX4577129.1 LPXTG cell wall anchor domain-containing protein [Streptomyces sp. NBC_01571]